MKFALISNILPPSETAHAAIIERLLRDLDPSTYCLLSSRDYVSDDQPNYSRRLPGKYYYLPPVFRMKPRWLMTPRVVGHLNIAAPLLQRALQIARIVRRERCQAIVACTGGSEIFDFPAGYLASRLTRVPFYAYLLDQYAQMVTYVLRSSSLLQHLEPWIMKRAAAVIVPNEFLCDEVRRVYNVEAVIIHNACDLAMYGSAQLHRLTDNIVNSEKKIVYTGGVGELHYDAFRNLVSAIGLLKQDIKIHLFLLQSKDYLRDEEGIRGPVVYHGYLPLSEMPAVQKGADLLFLPLTFNPSFHQIVRTAAPGKMGEFLAAGRPILVHAPADSFIAWYFRKHQCGIVVDRAEPAELAHAIELLLSDQALREKLVARARERAEVDFDHLKARKQFADLLDLNAPPKYSVRGISPCGDTPAQPS